MGFLKKMNLAENIFLFELLKFDKLKKQKNENDNFNPDTRILLLCLF